MAAAAIDDLTYVGLDKRAHGRVRNDDFTIIGRMRAHFAAFEAAIKVNVSLVGIFKKFKELEGELTKELSFEYFKLCLHRIRHPEKNKAYPRKKQVVQVQAAPTPAPIAPVATPVAAAPVVEPPQSEEDEFAGLNARQRREKRLAKALADLPRKVTFAEKFLARQEEKKQQAEQKKLSSTQTAV